MAQSARYNANARKGRKPRTKKATKPLVKLIRDVATKTANAGLETKYVTQEVNNLSFNSSVSNGNEQISLIPPCGSGTDTYQRVGVDITPVRIKNTWIVSLSPVSRSLNLIVDLFCLQSKDNRYYPDQVGSGPPYFLRTGSSAGNGIQLYRGLNVDSFRMINKENYTLLKHFRFPLVGNVGLPNGDTTTGNAPNVSQQQQKTIEYIVDHPKQLRYTPGQNTVYPSGHAPFWVLGYSKADGTAPDVANQSVVVSFLSEMMYKDG